jgi:uncharacterized protein YndB with AHSA1/START domain
MGKATKGEERIYVEAPPEKVYELVSDLSRMGEWSPECYRCAWVKGATGPTVGAEFEGHNRIGLMRWTAKGQVVAARPGAEFAFSTFSGDREETRWRYRFEPVGAGTDVVESYEFFWAPWYVGIVDLFLPRDRELHAGMRQTLARIKAAAETSA